MLSRGRVQLQTGGQKVSDAETLHSSAAVLQPPVLFCCPMRCIVMQRRGTACVDTDRRLTLSPVFTFKATQLNSIESQLDVIR